jgi:uncharacterized RDD family membrane protein YckC
MIEALDSQITVETPEGIEFTLFPAGPLIRGCAWGIDQAIQWTIIIIIFSVAGFFSDSPGSWLILLLRFLIDWFYHVGWELLGRGQSPGKRLLGIRVVRSDGSPVNPGASFLRNLLRFADTFLSLYSIALVVMLASKGFRRLGDWTGDTLVVYTAQSLSLAVLPLRVTAAAGAAGAGLPGPGDIPGEEKQGILMFARRYPLLGKARANEIAAPYVTARLWQAARQNGEFYPDEGEIAGESEGAAEYVLGLSRKLSGDP